MLLVFFLVQKLSQNFALCTCLKPKVDLFDPEWKEAQFSVSGQFAREWHPQQSVNLSGEGRGQLYTGYVKLEETLMVL